jgi:imidazolonepropionase-like amidohydrolase
MKLAIVGGDVVTGDGTTVLEHAAVLVEDGFIVGVEARYEPTAEFEVLEATGCIVMPGLVNCHTHAVTPAPFMPSGGTPPSRELWLANLDRHLMEATTTVLNLCGFATMADVAEADTSHPVNVKTATCHTPKCFAAADAADGAGLGEETRRLSVEQMLDAGAVAIGEIGAGHTLGGGGQDYMYIPLAIQQETGVWLEPSQARDLKYAALGRHIYTEMYDGALMEVALAAADLTHHITPERARDIVRESVLPSFYVGLEAFDEAAAAALGFGVPALFHNSAPSAKAMIEISRDYAERGATIIACHSNHPNFEPAEGLEVARACREYGAVIECSTVDTFITRRIVDSRENWDVLFEDAGLVELLATDYAGGGWDSLPVGIKEVVEKGFASVPATIAMATSRPADLFPGLAPNRGRLERGRVADIAIVNSRDIAQVRQVIVAGQVEVRDGQRAQRELA